MATSITIRNIPDEIYEKLRRRAGLHQRSMNSEIIFHLKKMVQSHRREPAGIIARAKKLKKKAKESLSIGQIQESIDSGRK